MPETLVENVICATCEGSIHPDARDSCGNCPTCTRRCANCCQEVQNETVLDSFRCCEDCHTVCEHCENDVDPTEGLDSVGACSECHVECTECGSTLHPENDSVSPSGRCEDCALYCRECGDEIGPREEYFEVYCAECAPRCSHCGEVSRDRNLDGLCESCSDEEEESRVLHEYGYQPDPVFRRAKGENPERNSRGSDASLYLGIEVEIDLPEGRRDRASDIEDIAADDTFWYCKEDGSLRHGIEYVSHPATWAFWEKVSLDWTKTALSLGYRAWDVETCGQHVHVSRAAVSGLTLFKLLTFFHAQRSWLTSLSERSEGSMERYCAIAAPPFGYDAFGCTVPRSFATALLRGLNGGRYRAINWSERKTVEFRLWRGTLAPEGIRRNLALTACLVLWARETSIRDITSLAGFKLWIRERAARYVGSKAVKSILERIEKCA